MIRASRQRADNERARRRAEQALAESAREYPLLAESLPDALFITDRSGLVCFVNSAACRFFRRPVSALVGKRQTDLFPQPVARQHTRAIQKVCRTGQPHIKMEPERLPGTDLWIETRLQPIRNRRGRITHVLGLARDISARVKAESALRESEENFRAMAENGIDAILIAVPPGHQVFVNRRLAELTGYSIRELHRMHISRLARPPEARRVLDMFRRRLRGEEAPQRYEAMILRKDGRETPVEVSATRTLWQGRAAVMAIVRDVAVQRRLAEERRRLASRLIEIQERERRLISSALHDHLGQILTLARLEMGAVQPARRDSILHRQKALLRLDEALATVRNLATSLRPPILDDLDLETALEDLAGQFGDSGIDIRFSHRGRPSPQSRQIKTCLYRVTQEALTNVVRHAQATRVRIHLDVRAGTTRLTIRDDGKGFDQAAIPESQGIGLAGMRERLRLCRGRLEIRSVKGRGTGVVAVIPPPGSRVILEDIR
ncbi:MAG TPA: PAS domain S-box protein [Kiritimatiellia bacterium]|nr:PAS domain S-box protein [Kiritimatiellia bacterium]HRZ11573.1 PAS domain S-box protein [Kiritimatiellia bacterium]HSA16876.1 PAS domain S-box protein [Kiritimatiellia bacterium]